MPSLPFGDVNADLFCANYPDGVFATCRLYTVKKYAADPNHAVTKNKISHKTLILREEASSSNRNAVIPNQIIRAANAPAIPSTPPTICRASLER